MEEQWKEDRMCNSEPEFSTSSSRREKMQYGFCVVSPHRRERTIDRMREAVSRELLAHEKSVEIFTQQEKVSLGMKLPEIKTSPKDSSESTGVDSISPFSNKVSHAISCEIIGCDFERRKKHSRSFITLAFIIEVVDNGVEHTVRRNYFHIKALHNKLKRKFPRSTASLHLPPCKTNKHAAAYIEARIEALNAYFNELTSVQEFVKSDEFKAFFEDFPQSEESENDDDFVASNTLLQSFPASAAAIKSGESFLLTLEIPRAGSVVAWQFSTRKYDIAFSVQMNGQEVCMYSREPSHEKEIKGFYLCASVGVCTLNWDNSYSWRRGKRLTYRAEVLDPDLMSATQKRLLSQESNFLAKDIEIRAIDDVPSAGHAEIGKVGYVARTGRMHSPGKRLVNSTFAMLGLRSNILKDGRETKVGFLIMHIGSKFRNREKRWYRRWFALDVKKGVMRCYNAELRTGNEVTKAKILLTKSNSSLSVVRSARSAPTPYCFNLKSGRRRWELCAETDDDFNEWREAIFTSMHLAHWTNQKKENKGSQSGDSSDSDEEDGNDSSPMGAHSKKRDTLENEEDNDQESESSDSDYEVEGKSVVNKLPPPTISQSSPRMLSSTPSHRRFIRSLQNPKPFLDIPRRSGTWIPKLCWLGMVNVVLLCLRNASPLVLCVALLLLSILSLRGTYAYYYYEQQQRQQQQHDHRHHHLLHHHTETIPGSYEGKLVDPNISTKKNN